MVTHSSQVLLLKEMLTEIVAKPKLHSRWLNTLSYMENCGARLIANCEHPTKVKAEMLKHAAEEFRHAYYLKQQISKVSSEELENYSLKFLIGGNASKHYLTKLNLRACSYLKKNVGLSGASLKQAAYILVTYTIELRAGELYPLYHEILKAYGSKVTVKSILLEEEEHLEEMRCELRALPHGQQHADAVARVEEELFHSWILELAEEINPCVTA